MRILVTGAAGFIGSHVCARLLKDGHQVLGVDNFNDYYAPSLKRDRIKHLLADSPSSSFQLQEIDIAEDKALSNCFSGFLPDRVVHLAAQAGVRYSLINPQAYVQSNLVGFANMLEMSKKYDVKHLVYASSSSVYGWNTKLPFAVGDVVDEPVSFYAATKKSNELMAHAYSHLFNLPTTGLRYFTVYGPWGRPDMAMWLFTASIFEGKPIRLFNHGNMLRDFTFIDDIVEGSVQALYRMPPALEGKPPYQLFNIGNHQPVPLNELIRILEDEIGRSALLELAPMQSGDVPATFADVNPLKAYVGFQPNTPLEKGVERWIRWYSGYHRKDSSSFL